MNPRSHPKRPWQSAGIFLVILSSASHAWADYSATILADGPVAYYRLNDNAVTPLYYATNIGSLGVAGNGTYAGVYTRGVPGAIEEDAAVAFLNPSLGTGFTGGLNVPNNAALNPAGGFTIEFWVKATNNTAALLSPVNSMSFVSGRAGYLFYQNAATWQMRVGVTTSTTASTLNGGTVLPNEWQHVVGVYSGGPSGTITLYVDGVQVGTAAATYETNTDAPFCIGATSAPNRTFDGSVDEVAFYSAVLSADVIAAHHAARTTNAVNYASQILSSNPVGYWRLNEAAAVPVVAANAGTMGTAVNGTYRYWSANAAGLSGSGYPGFETANTVLQTSGSNGLVAIPPLNLNGNNVTLECWIKRNGNQPDYAGVFFHRGGAGTATGIDFRGTTDTLGYHWNDQANTYGWASGLLPPNDLWTYVALAVSPNNATMYMFDGTTWSSAMNNVDHPVQAFADITRLGADQDAARFFQGQIDEAAVYGKTLSEGQLRTHALAGFGDPANNPPVILTEPPQQTPDVVYATTTFRLLVDAYGMPPLTYQWQHEGTNLPGATSSSLVITNASEKDSGGYVAVVTNPHGSATNTTPMFVYVNPIVPVYMMAEPRSQVRYEGGRAVFKVTVDGTEPKFQWKFNGINMSDATNATLVVSPVGPTNTGTYTVVATNAAGSVTSQPATLAIRSVTAGSFEQLIVSLSPVAYWRLDETAAVWESPVAWDYMGGYDGEHTSTVETGVAGPRPPQFPGIEADNRAARYEGTASGTTTGVQLLNNRAQFSILGWFKPNGTQPQGRTALFGQNDVAEFGYHGTDAIGLWTPGGGYISFASSLVETGKWYFITATADGNQMRLYLNGQQVAAGGNATANYGSAATGFNIGTAVLDSTGNWFLGDIDDVAFFDRALSLQEIFQINSKAAGIELKLNVSTSPSVFVADSKPEGVPHDGRNNNATWIESSTDALSKTRTGVMQFSVAANSQVVIPWHTDFGTTQGTIGFWIKSAGTSGAGNEGSMIIDRRASAGDVIVLADGGGIFWQPEWIYTAQTTGLVNDDNWHHIAYVFNQEAEGSVTVYIDGVLDTTRPNTRAWSWPAQQIEIGRSHDAWWKILEGLLDDIRFYNVQLTQPQIAQIVAGETALVEPTKLVARYNFDTAPISGIQITWPMGILEQADNVTGPYTEVTGATTPYVIRPLEVKKFYRLRL